MAPTGTSWATEKIHYALTETTGTVVGLADTGGVAKAQYHWDPYGELLAVDLAAGVPRNRVGHQGLFMDRLDIGTQHDQLVRGADVLAQNRNRTYAPALGRFLQRDPNGAGAMLSPGFVHSGLAAAASPPQFDIRQRYMNGVNVYTSLGANPVLRTDPSGLFDMIGLMMGMSSMQEVRGMYDDNVLDAGLSFSEGIGGIFDAAALDQLTDLEWALDWSQPDDHYTSSAAYSDGTGSWAGAWGGDAELSSELAMGSSGDFGRGKPGKAIHGGVYRLRNPRTGEVYIGRTVDFSRRELEHTGPNGKFEGWKFERIHTNLTYNQMRGLEQLELEKAQARGKTANKVRGISKANRYRSDYLKAARAFLRGGR